eukprot:767429-Hanusia_phi.AAC.3
MIIRSYGSQPTCRDDGVTFFHVFNIPRELNTSARRRHIENWRSCMGCSILPCRRDFTTWKNVDLNVSLKDAVDVAALDWDDEEAAGRLSARFDWVNASDWSSGLTEWRRFWHLTSSTSKRVTLPWPLSKITLISYESRSQIHDQFFTTLEQDTAFTVKRISESCFARPEWSTTASCCLVMTAFSRVQGSQDIRIYAIARARKRTSSERLSLNELQQWREELDREDDLTEAMSSKVMT